MGSDAVRAMRAGAAVVTALAIGLLLPSAASAQRYQLRLAPAPGDTLRMQVDQETEVTGEERADAPSRSMRATLRIYSHAIVLGRSGGATTLIAKTDSVSVASDDAHAEAVGAQMRRLAGARPIRIALADNGTVRLLDDAGNVVPDGRGAVSLIPAALPEGALAVGDTWVRAMPLPVGSSVDAGMVRATFRLDSVSRGGQMAYISVRGDLARGDLPAAGPRGTMMRVAGTVAGLIRLDRVRGWIAESRFVVTMHSAVEPPAQSGIAPVKFRTVVTQRMRLQGRAPARRARPAAPAQPGRP